MDNRISPHPSQSGMALLIGLIFLVVLSIIGATALRMSGLEERMSGNLRERSLAFEAAESALRQGEDDLQAATLPAFDDNPGSASAGTNKGLIKELCEPGDPTAWADTTSAATCTWMDLSSTAKTYIATRKCWKCSNYNWTQHAREFKSTNALMFSSSLKLTSPRYVIEELPSIPVSSSGGSIKGGKALEEVSVYRITARGVGPSGVGSVIIQETYRR